MPATDLRRLADLMTTLQGNLLGIGVGNAVIAIGMVIGLQNTAPTALLLAWLLVQLTHSGFSLWAWWRVKGHPASVRSAAQRARASEVSALFSGLLWAASVPLFWPTQRLDLQLLIITMITGLISGAIHSLSAHIRAFYRFLLPNVLAVIGVCLWQGGTLHAVIALTALVYGVTSVRFARAMHDVQVKSLQQRDSLAALAADLQIQKERAETALRSKSLFLAAASHDIRQPVHALSMFLGAFDDRTLLGRNAELIGPLRECSRSLREMLDGVLDLSRAEAQQVPGPLYPVSLQTLLDTLERDFAAQAEAKGLVLRCVPTRSWVLADALLLERVMRNLVSNAVRYTQRGGVLVGARQRGPQAVLEVWDTGPGITEDARDSLFGEFTRGAGASEAAPGGLGLGLAIASRFALALGSSLQLQSRLHSGSVFRLALTTCPAPVVQTSPPQAEPNLQGLRVLVIDDDASVRAAMLALLQGWGCSVQLLPDPQALEQVPETDVVLLDNRFGGTNRAHEVVATLRQCLLGQPQIIVITGQPGAPNLQPLHAAGVTVLTKPAAAGELRQVLGRSR